MFSNPNQANKKGPEFETTYANTEQSIKVHFSALEVLLHQEAIISVLKFVQTLVTPPSSSTPPPALSLTTTESEEGLTAAELLKKQFGE